MSSGFFKKGMVGVYLYDHIQLMRHQEHCLYREPILDEPEQERLVLSEEDNSFIFPTKHMERERFAKELNDWSAGPLVNSYGVVRQNGKAVRIRSLLKKMYTDILEALKECDYQFECIDEKQFKEEFIYFMYILSDIQR